RQIEGDDRGDDDRQRTAQNQPDIAVFPPGFAVPPVRNCICRHCVLCFQLPVIWHFLTLSETSAAPEIPTFLPVACHCLSSRCRTRRGANPAPVCHRVSADTA